VVARLAARIGRLEKIIPRPEPGCDLCRGRLLWFDKHFTHVEVNGNMVPACASCARLLPAPIKVISGIDPDECL